MANPSFTFDNAATTQKPQVVVDALTHYYSTLNANVHKGLHQLSEKSTAAFEQTREALREMINARSTNEIIFTKGTTDGINLLAHSFGKAFIKKNDEIVISAMEHHSNIVPWQMLCEQIGAKLKVIPVTDSGDLDMEAYKKLLNDKTKLVAVVWVSNALGTVNPIQEIIDEAKKAGAYTMVDAAQAICHFEVDVQAMDADFMVFSGHKMCGPTGTGTLYGKYELLEQMPPYQGGGEMIKEVDFEGTTYNEPPHRFEAGTPNIADMIALKAAIDYMKALDKAEILAHEAKLLGLCYSKIRKH